MRDRLEAVPLPDEQGARERSWPVVRAGFEARELVPAPRRRVGAAIVALAVAAATVAAVASPPGRAVLDEIREVVGVERAQPALFSLPTAGRLLVTSGAGVWIVQRDGSRRLLGTYREASWSPFGRYVVAARQNELAALEPDGDVRWTLARRGVRFPRWTGSETDTRIAYLSGASLRIVPGDGSGDRLAARPIAPVAPAWRPAGGFVVTYADSSGRVVTLDVERRSVLWRTPPGDPVASLAWSSDGRRLHVQRQDSVDVHTRSGALWTAYRGGVTGTALRPGSHAAAVALARGARSEVVVVGDPASSLFSGAGRFADLRWSPDGAWLLIGWPEADQWVFVRADGRRIRAVSNVSEQFRSRDVPRVESWCCVRSKSS